MAAKTISGVEWYVDRDAQARDEPGIAFSFMAALATALQARGEAVAPAWLMGASGWAFRLLMEEQLCPSSTSVFDWGLLPASVHGAGWDCTYVSRLWHEDAVRAERRAEAHAAIVAGIDAGTPAAVWDVQIPEWGVVTGYDDAAQAYAAIAGDGRHCTLPYELLGEREIRILSVTVPGARKAQSGPEAVRRALETAVRHARGGEWAERPGYQNGLAAFEQWARAMTKYPATDWDAVCYQAAHWAGARCYARDFMRGACSDCPNLKPAADAYDRIAACLLAVWRECRALHHASASMRAELAAQLREAACYEGEAIAAIERHLATAQTERPAAG